MADQHAATAPLSFHAASLGLALKIAALLLALVLACLVRQAPAHAADDFRLLEIAGTPVKWGPRRFGTAARVTYALADRNRAFGDARNCAAMTPMDGLLAASGLSEGVFLLELEAALALWEEAAGVDFVRVRADAKPQILLGAQASPRGLAFTDVAPEQSGDGGVRRIGRALVCLNPELVWRPDIDGDKETLTLRYVLAHEIGHALGLDHRGRSGALMSFAYHEEEPALSPADRVAVQALYGVRGRPASLIAVAAPPRSARLAVRRLVFAR